MKMYFKRDNIAWKKGTDGVYIPTGICSICGKEYTNGNAPASLYCLECSKEITKKKTAERVRRYRARKRAINGN